MNFNIKTVPFSTHGSFLVISHISVPGYGEGLYIRNIRGGDEDLGPVFKIDVIDEHKDIVPYEVQAEPALLSLLTKDEGKIRFCFSSPETIRIQSCKYGVRLTAVTGSYDYSVKNSDGTWEINSFAQEIRFNLAQHKGEMHVDAPFKELRSTHMIIDLIPNERNGLDAALTEYKTVLPKQPDYQDFESVVEKARSDFRAWVDKMLPAPKWLKPGHDLATYITWSCVVKSEGLLTRKAMYMSKNWMTNIWSWDNCFNAMALAKHQPELAWDQFMIFFDHQDESGVLPDFINNRYALWNCCKPPIHGWTLKCMMERTDYIGKEQLQEVYEPLCKWTDWWMNYRDDDGDGIPQYNHGNDSGWDNSTIFHSGTPIESPDLSAFLILQMEVLSEIGRKLGRDEEAFIWQERSEFLLKRMVEHFWKDGKFVALKSGEHTHTPSESLVLFIPLILGHRLGEEITAYLISGLKNFFTDHGFATERLSSPYYREDGYWRGPIWAPTTLILIKALKSVQQLEFASEAAKRFCRMANENGMAENFNAKTGEGLRDRAFTWTSSVFLLLANEYLRSKDYIS
ncbi:amylo-alpha-1,6-glucosidase [Lederbergia citrea]|uniref:Mannosylglycerate hydrolase MGH1-like glycoside hydrolase domain-containing protein n=1 Tax=Lederbergia citrea TaxID=2833581 RepID=A0A942Z3N4_9BACI|nr:trehalase family glycosidase [Lederbergia citrea]MBS4176023.1 hypothetical protein [Lederbergia citrea]MBS4222749.1 hypothetical protein [Lederbergia citrea]